MPRLPVLAAALLALTLACSPVLASGNKISHALSTSSAPGRVQGNGLGAPDATFNNRDVYRVEHTLCDEGRATFEIQDVYADKKDVVKDSAIRLYLVGILRQQMDEEATAKLSYKVMLRYVKAADYPIGQKAYKLMPDPEGERPVPANPDVPTVLEFFIGRDQTSYAIKGSHSIKIEAYHSAARNAPLLACIKASVKVVNTA